MADHNDAHRDTPGDHADDESFRRGHPSSKSDDGATARAEKPSAGKVWRDRILLIVIVWAVWAFITSFIVQPFRIPSQSMENTLRVGDRIVVSKFTPRFSDVKRGDVVVFKDPGGWSENVPSKNPLVKTIRSVAEFTHLSASGSHLVKRVVGIGGDTVSCKVGGKLTVNGKQVNEPYIKKGEQACNIAFNIKVPNGKVWVLGDNRGNSADSRYHDPNGDGSQGSVPVDDITGKVVAVVWPVSHIGGGGSDEDVFKGIPAGK